MGSNKLSQSWKWEERRHGRQPELEGVLSGQKTHDKTAPSYERTAEPRFEVDFYEGICVLSCLVKLNKAWQYCKRVPPPSSLYVRNCKNKIATTQHEKFCRVYSSSAPEAVRHQRSLPQGCWISLPFIQNWFGNSSRAPPLILGDWSRSAQLTAHCVYNSLRGGERNVSFSFRFFSCAGIWHNEQSLTLTCGGQIRQGSYILPF